MSLFYKSKFHLPSCWDRSPMSNSQYLKIEGLKVTYIGPGETDTQAASVKANFPIPPDCPVYYYEVEIVSKGQRGYIGVGFQGEKVQLARLPGWELDSYGYHGDDGSAFSGSGSGKNYGPRFTTGDVIGCLLNRVDNSISFYKNGVFLDVAFVNVTEERLYPVVGLRTRGEEVVVNFGETPFNTDVQQVLESTKRDFVTRVQSSKLPYANSEGNSVLLKLIYDYLLHHRCWKTAASISKDLFGEEAMKVDDVPQDIALRQQVWSAVCGGRTQEAVDLVESTYGKSVLEQSPRLHFRLRVQCFVDLMTSGEKDVSVALAYGRTMLTPHMGAAGEQELIQDAVSLIAYVEPETSPCGYLLKQPHREALAESLNGAILAHLGRPANCPLERCVAQAVTVADELKRTGNSLAYLLDPLELLQAPHPPALAPVPCKTAGEVAPVISEPCSMESSEPSPSLVCPDQMDEREDTPEAIVS